MAAILGLIGYAAGNNRPLVLDIGPGELLIGPQTTPQKANRIDLRRPGRQDMDMQQERVAMVGQHASICGRVRREQHLDALLETKPA